MRVLLSVGLVFSVLVTVMAPAAGCGGVAPPPTAQAGSVCGAAPASKCTQDGTFFIVTAECCGFLNCSAGLQSPAYALCDGTSFSECTCTEPTAASGWTQIHPPMEPDANSFPDIVVPEAAPPPDTSTDTNGEAGSESGGDSTPPGETGPIDAGKDVATTG